MRMKSRDNQDNQSLPDGQEKSESLERERQEALDNHRQELISYVATISEQLSVVQKFLKPLEFVKLIELRGQTYEVVNAFGDKRVRDQTEALIKLHEKSDQLFSLLKKERFENAVIDKELIKIQSEMVELIEEGKSALIGINETSDHLDTNQSDFTSKFRNLKRDVPKPNSDLDSDSDIKEPLQKGC